MPLRTLHLGNPGLSGAHLVLVPTAVAASEPFADVYELKMRAAAVTHGVYIAMANRSGREDPLQFLGRSMIIDPTGNVVASLADESNKTLTVELSQEKVIKARQLFPFLRDRRPETYGAVARIPDGDDNTSAR